MAYFFLPSSLQKRLLRYALSQVDLLDTEALDLDKLDIGWGKTSTIELHDVGLSKSKLASILSLPQQVNIKHAAVATVKITVPADIHTSSIVIAINGVRVALNVREDDDTGEGGLGSSSLGPKETGLPSVNNLTKSFLAEEPITKQRELAAALASRSPDLRQSVTSVTSADSELDEGVGTGIGLPGFLTAFFRGIGERLQIVLEDVAFTLDLFGLIGDDHHGERAVPAALALEIASIDIRDQKSEVGSTSQRRVVLGHVRCSLLDEHLDEHSTQPASPFQNESSAYSLQDALRACRADIEARPSSTHRLRRSFDGSGARTPTSSGPQNGISSPIQPGSKATSPPSPSCHRAFEEDGAANQPGATHSNSETLSVSGEGDLTQSTLFSKDDAESLYMSALDASSPVASFRAEMPGGWGMDSEISSWTHHRSPQHDTQTDDHSEPLSGRDTKQNTLPALASTYRVIAVLDRVELWIPAETVQDNDTDPASTLPRQNSRRTPTSSTAPPQTSMTGSFSTYANKRPQERHSMKDTVPAAALKNNDPRIDAQTMSDALEAIAGSGTISVDLPTVKLLLSVNKQFQAKVNGAVPAQNSPERVQSSSSLMYSLKLQSMSVNVVESLELQTWQTVVTVTMSTQSQHTLCSLKLQDVRLTSRKEQLRCDISKASFAVKNRIIISFDEQVRMRTSVRDLREQSDDDISVTFGVEGGRNAVNVATKPLKLLIDIEELGDMIESFGGFNTILGLFQPPSSHPEHARAHVDRRRVVRFESASIDKSHRVENDFRLNVRLGGASVVIRGSRQSLECNTSAIKFVGRQNALGLSIDDIRLLGPSSGTDEKDSSIMLQLNDLRLKHLPTPEEADLTRLIALLTPSKERFGDDDDVLVDTLLRQRRKGATLRVSLSSLELDVLSRSMALEAVEEFGHDFSRLLTLAQYLPEDDRPGLMVLANIEEISVNLETEHAIGTINLSLHKNDFAHVSVPSLFACSVEGFNVERNDQSTLITQVIKNSSAHRQPTFTARMIGDEPEPVLKVRLWNLMFEYNIPLIVAALGISDLSSTETLVTDLAASIATLSNGHDHESPLGTGRSTPDRLKAVSKEYCLDLGLRDCAVGLEPKKLTSKALFLLSDATLTGSLPSASGVHGQLNIRKGAVLLVDDVNNLVPHATRGSAPAHDSSKDQIAALCRLGFVPVSSMSAAVVDIRLRRGGVDTIDSLEISFKDELFVLETCADSTQTLLDTLNDLMPPMPPPKGIKYRTEVTPVEDMLASFSGNAFDIKSDSGNSDLDASDVLEDEADMDQDYEDLGVTASAHTTKQSFPSVPNGVKARASRFGSAPHRLEELRETERKRAVGMSRRPPTAKKWDSVNNRYVPMTTSELTSMPLHVKVREVHFIWHLFDGYDWQKTRNTITKAVHEVENRAEERRRRPLHDEEQESEPLIGDFLFNSIYIGVPANADPQDLTRQINRNMDELVSETASLASTATTSRPTSAHRMHAPHRKLKLTRSKRHKLAIELRGVSADVFMLGPDVETQSSIDVRVTDLDIFDHVPTSTWKKFATYMHDAGPRNEDQPMVHLEICNVRPIPELLASELVIRATVLPIRLHVDQDALDFMTRFFEFKDDSALSPNTPVEEPYLQRVEVLAVPVKMDYKPKKVDFAGIRSGRTTEFMNFFVLESADFVLKHTIVYGTSGFIKLRQSLEDVWMPDVKHNQLPTVLAGLQGVRTVVNVGTGVRDLVMIPIQEYKKDGRIVRSISKGAAAFAKTTGGELTKFGARLAIGAQNALQGAEAFLAGESAERTWDDDDDAHDEEKRTISHYANQPAGILQGLRGAARSLERDILVTKDAIIAISGEMRETGTAEGAARAVARHGPTLILRPMIGASKAISQTLMGATNTVDPQNRRRVEDKYKKY